MKEGSHIVNQSKEATRKQKKRRGGTSFSGSKERRRRELKKKVFLSENSGETIRTVCGIGEKRVRASRNFESGIVGIAVVEESEEEEKGVRFKRLSTMTSENERAPQRILEETDFDDETVDGSIATVRIKYLSYKL